MIEKLISVAALAATEICEIYQQGEAEVQQQVKLDGSPLTQADMRSHQVLVEGLANFFPDIPILSEENAKEIPWEERQKWKQFLLVDPLDGTQEFLNRNGEFTINIALIEEGKPVVGVIHVPISGECYFAEKGRGAFHRFQADTLQLHASPGTGRRMRVTGSRSHASAQLDKFTSLLNNPLLLSKGSALKFCMIAEGKADVYPRHGSTSLWDVAAGHCIVSEAGGFVCDQFGEDLTYGTKEDLLNPPFVSGVVNRTQVAKLFAASL